MGAMKINIVYKEYMHTYLSFVPFSIPLCAYPTPPQEQYAKKVHFFLIRV